MREDEVNFGAFHGIELGERVARIDHDVEARPFAYEAHQGGESFRLQERLAAADRDAGQRRHGSEFVDDR